MLISLSTGKENNGFMNLSVSPPASNEVVAALVSCVGYLSLVSPGSMKKGNWRQDGVSMSNLQCVFGFKHELCCKLIIYIIY